MTREPFPKRSGNGKILIPVVIGIFVVLLCIGSLLLSHSAAAAQTISNNISSSSSAGPKENDNVAVVSIPKGAANPEIDLTLQKVGNWYTPNKITIPVGGTVIWKNQDTDAHTVTSGLGAGIQSVQTNQKGKPDGIFDSGIIKPGQSWSHTFYNPGTYNYFCTIHPWMEAAVVVNPVKNLQQIPNYPVDASGNRQDAFPIYVFSKDNKYEVGLKWDPVPILTGKIVTFIAEFFDVKTNTLIQLAPYDFVIIQNGHELDRIHGLTQVGSGVHKFVFSRAGPITVRIENIGGDDKNAFGEFSTIVYPNPNISASTAAAITAANNTEGITRVSGGTEPVSRILNPLTLVWITYGVIIGLPIAAGVGIILYKKGII
jgi:plastocyanin